jgi:hypothetical protein
MPQFSQWTRPQRRGLLFLVLVVVVGHLLLFHANQEQQHTTHYATISELAENPYISPRLASRIVVYRTFHEEKMSWNSIADKFELDSIRIARIALYLK